MELTKCDKIIMGIMRNNANRAANCDKGNIKKQVKASSAQIKVINDLNDTGALKNLSEKLQATAQMRLKHPDATYAELAELLNITKSGVVNRLRKITQLHNSL